MRMPVCVLWLAAISILAGCRSPDSAAAGLPRGYVCAYTTKPPVVNGKLEEPAWQQAPWTEPFVDIEGAEKPAPAYPTRVKMLWDDEYFYVGARLTEPHVWATITERDSVVFHDNDFEVFIDPDGDNHDYYELEINAFNTVWDLRLVKPYRDGGPALNDWNVAGLKSAVHVDGTLNEPGDVDSGWMVELAIPWSVLAEHTARETPPDEGDQWRVNFSRVEWQHEIVEGGYEKAEGVHENNWVWSPQGVIDMHRPERWGFVQFTKGDPETTRFVGRTSQTGREYLMDIYYAQRSFHKRFGQYASSLAELGLQFPHHPDLLSGPFVRRTGTGFEASLQWNDRGVWETWFVREDSLLSKAIDRGEP